MAGRKTVLVTGATSGIGYGLAKIFAKQGYNLILVSRRRVPLEQVAHELNDYGNLVKVIVSDLGKEGAAELIFKDVSKSRLHVDILVNNAGVGFYGRFDQVEPVRIEQMMGVNIVSLTNLTRLFLPEMIEKHEGKILNVASTAAFAPGPYMAVYYATKAYVVSFSRAIASELSGTGVSVTALCPGPTATNFQERARAKRNYLSGKLFMMDAQTVAKVGYKGLMDGESVVIPGWRNKAMVFLADIMPGYLVVAVIKYLQRKTRA